MQKFPIQVNYNEEIIIEDYRTDLLQSFFETLSHILIYSKFFFVFFAWKAHKFNQTMRFLSNVKFLKFMPFIRH